MWNSELLIDAADAIYNHRLLFWSTLTTLISPIYSHSRQLFSANSCNESTVSTQHQTGENVQHNSDYDCLSYCDSQPIKSHRSNRQVDPSEQSFVLEALDIEKLH